MQRFILAKKKIGGLGHFNSSPSVVSPGVGLTLETSAFRIFHGGNSTFINSFDLFHCQTDAALVSYAAVLSLVTQRSSPRGALRDETKNGCVGD